MRNLNYQLKQLCRRNRDGGHVTRYNRERMLTLFANQLHEMGFHHMVARSLKPKHVEALVKQWQGDGVSVGTIKNRLSVLRWWAEKVDKRNVMARSNDHYGVGRRRYVGGESRALELDAESLDRIGDAHVRLSVELQRAFGLRREEAIKFRPVLADRGDRICLKASWTKGGKAREVPVRTAAQRELLDRVHALVKRGALIPPQRNYREQRLVYERETAKARFRKLHRLRHAYAQARYEELTGWKAPVAGGPSSKSLSEGQRAKDWEARLVISRKLGHARPEIVRVYCGT